ncbi:hypothetical protein [Polyangium sp. y55x31]|uniref:hypothetical protein n=1 Tax=Polyangium sp. y55x31 TaxID=3042688 RepID=UPI0024821421|nr:hypothetical protein [Polyangium sp. y55x31]MDI1475398.1 hypothetical protein [Polyangium sp. y55x31]
MSDDDRKAEAVEFVIGALAGVEVDTVLAARARNGEAEIRPRAEGSEAPERTAALKPAHREPIEEYRGMLWQGDDPGLACPVPFELFEGVHAPGSFVPRGEHDADVR